MKKYIVITFIALVLSPTLSYAESDENVTKRRPDGAVTPRIMEIREDKQTRVQELRSHVAQNHANRLERRFNFYVERLTKIMTRFENRLNILKAQGKDTTASQSKLDSAKAKLEEARAMGKAAVDAFKAIDPAKFSEQKAAAFAARDLANAARKLFKETHDLLKEALKLLKTISKPALPAASPSL